MSEPGEIWPLLDERAALCSAWDMQAQDYRDRIKALPLVREFNHAKAQHQEELDLIDASIERMRLHRHQMTLPLD